MNDLLKQAADALPELPDVCDNCGEPSPGCSGLFASDGKVCLFHGIGAKTGGA